MLNELPKKNCLNCANFAWWDGDYCCTDKFKVLQESKDGKFNNDIIYALENNKDCSKWKKGNEKLVSMRMEAFNKYLKSINEKV